LMPAKVSTFLATLPATKPVPFGAGTRIFQNL